MESDAVIRRGELRTTQFAVAATNRSASTSDEMRSDEMRWGEWCERSLMAECFGETRTRLFTSDLRALVSLTSSTHLTTLILLVRKSVSVVRRLTINHNFMRSPL